jgi:hypothetical protein
MAKKIMFNDKYSLTQAVLDGRKTMTRRIIKCPRTFKGEWVAGFNIYRRHSDKKIVDWPCMYDADEREFDMGEILPKYKVGEVLSIAQSYESLGMNPEIALNDRDGIGFYTKTKFAPGWKNKMFVRADLMPHHIRITNIKIEKLQDISDEDCLKEGIVQKFDADGTPRYRVPCEKHTWAYATDSARDAYHFLIDKVSGKGTWESTPYVFAYEFELID